MFDLVRPCVTCPFRKGRGSVFQLRAERLTEIREAPAFQCHKTIDYDAWETGDNKTGDRPQQCAGLMAVLHREKQDNQIMQIAERFGHLIPAKLDPANEVYATWTEVERAHLEGIEP
jgi:hypothetical protein